jgi:hypothetical protein
MISMMAEAIGDSEPSGEKESTRPIQPRRTIPQVPSWTPEVFVSDDGQEPFTAFTRSLSDFKYVALDAAIRLVLAARGLDLVRTEWLKALGAGLHEFRVRHDADGITRMFGRSDDPTAPVAGPPEPVLLRVFMHFHGAKVILLLSGYDKGRDPSPRRQDREIAAARRYLRAWRAQEARRLAADRRKGTGPGRTAER